MARGTSDEGPDDEGPDDDGAWIVVRLDALLADRDMTLTELADRVGITIANLSVLKNGRARAIRFSTLAAICRELECTPGDVLDYAPRAPRPPTPRRPTP